MLSVCAVQKKYFDRFAHFPASSFFLVHFVHRRIEPEFSERHSSVAMGPAPALPADLREQPAGRGASTGPIRTLAENRVARPFLERLRGFRALCAQSARPSPLGSER